MTTSAHEVAAAGGHPEYWTTDDVETARALANVALQGGERTRTSAAMRWRGASRITYAERQHFHEANLRELHAREIATTARSPRTTRAQRRTALVHTLSKLGYVSIRRRADLVHQLASDKRQRLRD